MRTNSRAWTRRFEAVPWERIASWAHGLADANPARRPMAEIVDSIRACGGEERLAGLVTMDGLVVTPRPLPELPPVEEVVVQVSGNGEVLVEHLSTTGHDDRITRPGAEAVPLFWRFMIEKFGVGPDRSRLSSG